MRIRLIICYSVIFSLLLGCQPQSKEGKVHFDGNNPELVRASVKKLTDVIVYDIFTPPVASRIYAYTSLAAYEALRWEEPEKYPSLTNRLNGFAPMPAPEKGKRYSFSLAGIKAFMTVAEKITFSVDTLRNFEQEVIAKYEQSLDKDTYITSLQLGDSIGKVILAHAARDNYKESRGFSRYTITEGEDRWQSTPPDYADAVEPYWHKVAALAMDSASQCMPPPPLRYDMKKGSDFYKEAHEVFEVGKTLTDAQKQVARFWDDNPFVSHHTGHATFATKKMTPGGHWIAIATQISRQTNTDILKTTQTYALTAVALYDAFISCWEEKYRSQFVRPISVIRNYFDPNWESFLQTPPFPEYTSGHSVISASAATILTFLYGEAVRFKDTSELEYGMGERSFNSFFEASREAGLSRFYGGIHYKYSCIRGFDQGIKVGKTVLKKLGLKNELTSGKLPVSQDSTH